jgi:hypothetical protein
MDFLMQLDDSVARMTALASYEPTDHSVHTSDNDNTYPITDSQRFGANMVLQQRVVDDITQ